MGRQATGTTLCDTPVYRYALYRWSPTPYLVVAAGGTGEAAAQRMKTLEEAVRRAAQSDEPANIAWQPVDREATDALDSLPPALREAIEKAPRDETTRVWVVSPHGAIVEHGALRPADIEHLVDSPARHQIAEAIERARTGVFVLLESPDHPKENAAALATIQSTLKQVAEGKIKLNTAPTVDKVEAAVVRVARDAPREKGFVAQLLSVEPDLKTTEGPIIFLVFGRGRALFSCLGKGITTENLARDLEFIAGACSCTVKEQNPGVDLLMSCDWESVAAVVAEKYQGEEGADPLLDGNQLFPELALQPETPDADKTSEANRTEPVAAPADGTDRADGEAAEGSEPVASENEERSKPDVADKTTKHNDAAAPPPYGTAVADAQSRPADPRDQDEMPPSIGLGKVVVGLGLVLVGLFAVTWLVLRPRS